MTNYGSDFTQLLRTGAAPEAAPDEDPALAALQEEGGERGARDRFLDAIAREGGRAPSTEKPNEPNKPARRARR